MKRPILISILALVLFALGAYETLSMDGLNGLLLSWGDSTVYAAGYSDRAFRRVRGGMDIGAVHGLLGDPVGCRLRFRDILLENGTVVRKFTEYCGD